jgi:hypothetical protein
MSRNNNKKNFGPVNSDGVSPFVPPFNGGVPNYGYGPVATVPNGVAYPANHALPHPSNVVIPHPFNQLPNHQVRPNNSTIPQEPYTGGAKKKKSSKRKSHTQMTKAEVMKVMADTATKLGLKGSVEIKKKKKSKSASKKKSTKSKSKPKKKSSKTKA